VRIPDYISPIIGYRIWQWDAAGLKSLNGEPWCPRQPLSAVCMGNARSSISGLSKPATHDADELPSLKCTCGVYAAKNSEHIYKCGYGKFAVHGEVYLWGRVVEHERGWRAEFAYPKTFVLSPSALPFSLSTIDARLRTLTAFGTEIFILNNQQRIALWRKGSGYDVTGLDCLIAKRETYYVRRLHELTIKQGDRVAIIGHGIGVVKDSSPKDVTVVLGKLTPLRITRKQIIRDQQNNRWEWNPMSAEGSEYASSNLRPSQHQRSEL
jgi:hypothetical protein